MNPQAHGVLALAIGATEVNFVCRHVAHAGAYHADAKLQDYMVRLLTSS